MVNELPVDVLRELLRFDELSGKLYWRKRAPKWFAGNKRPEDVCARIWNAKYADKEAFTAIKDGYRVGAIFAVNYRANRVIFALINGRWPEFLVDHEDGVRDHNVALNLRDVPQSVNGKNCRMNADNTSGANGVYYDARRGTWSARARTAGQFLHLGTFKSKAAAIAARKAADRGLGFHQNHGISLSDAAVTNLRKLADRSERGKLQGSGDER